MNGTPQPNQKCLPALGIEPRSLNHESQPLTIGPFLTLVVKYFYIFQCKYTIEDGKLVKTQQGKPYNTSKYMELNTD